MKSRLKEVLRPLYENLLKDVSGFDYRKAFFCMQWGRNFPCQPNCGILFVGKATNGWITDAEDINVFFGTGEDRIFDRFDQMQWVENLEHNQSGYNTCNSAFWRVIKKVASYYYPQNWSSYIAWSNVCKAAPFAGGNPNDSLYYAQLEDCQKILKKEIEILSPKYVVFLTGKAWSVDFLRFINDGQETHSFQTEKWDKYECKTYLIKDVYCILSVHPQGKKETEHSDCIIKLINQNK